MSDNRGSTVAGIIISRVYIFAEMPLERFWAFLQHACMQY